MKIIRRLTLRTLLKNRKRTLVTIIGIILATALITAVGNMAASFRASMVEYEKAASGDYHYCFKGVSRENLKYFLNNRNIERLGYEADIGYALLTESQNQDKPYLYIKAMNEYSFGATALRLESGRLPENSSEIVIAKHVMTNGGVDIEVGDVLTLQLGYRDGGDGSPLDQGNPYTGEEEFVPQEEREFTVVGIIERPGYMVEAYTAPGYTAITCLDSINDADVLNIYVTYTSNGLKNREEVTGALLGGEDGQEVIADYVQENIWLLKWELLNFSNQSMNLLYTMAGIAVAIIIVASVFCIRNSFAISLTEKMKLYGMLASVGATKKQLRRMVYTEGALLGMFGIPLGVLSGILATFVLVKVTGGLMELSLGIGLIYAFSWAAVGMGILLSVVTILLSAGSSARKAGRVSPIQAIRGDGMIKISRRQVRTPRLIHLFFGVGGAIAGKNLRRARSKYRTTVISIVVSVTVFIALSTFVNLGMEMSGYYYEETGYQLHVTITNPNPEDSMRDAEWIAALPGVDYAEIRRMAMEFRLPAEEVPYTENYLKDFGLSDEGQGEVTLLVVALGEQAYQRYCSQVGVLPDDARDKGFLVGDYSFTLKDENGKTRIAQGLMYNFQPGDILSGTMGYDEQEKKVSIELLTQTDVRPYSLQNYGGEGFVVVSDEWMDQVGADYINDTVSVYLECEDADSLETVIQRGLDTIDYSLQNTLQEYRQSKAIYLLVAIFLYGFIAVIALIGITNIFNTITTNMELRAKEFAMLKSIGMTSREFHRMIRLENLMYASKALLISIPLGSILSYLFYIALDSFQIPYQLPVRAILLSVLAVAVLLFGTMHYSIGKINRKNIIETIQNENI